MYNLLVAVALLASLPSTVLCASAGTCDCLSLGHWAGDWSQCTKPCGGGIQLRQRTVTLAEQGAKGEHVLTTTRGCNQFECPQAQPQTGTWSEPEMACVKDYNLRKCFVTNTLEECKSHCEASSCCCSVDWTDLDDCWGYPGHCCLNGVGRDAAGPKFTKPCFVSGNHTHFAEMAGKCN